MRVHILYLSYVRPDGRGIISATPAGQPEPAGPTDREPFPTRTREFPPTERPSGSREDAPMSLMSRRSWTRLVTITSPFFRSDARGKACGLLALLITLLLTVSGLNVLNTFVNEHYINALVDHRAALFFSL